MNAIDYDKGIHKRTLDGIGLDVYMYINEPGVYLNAHGNEISVELARKAGFPVDEQTKQKTLRERMAKAMKKIQDEIGIAEPTKVVVKTRDGFTMVDIGLGRFTVNDPDGEVLTRNPMTEAEATIVFDQLVPIVPVVASTASPTSIAKK